MSKCKTKRSRFPNRIAQRRAEAEARQLKYNSLSYIEKLTQAEPNSKEAHRLLNKGDSTV